MKTKTNNVVHSEDVKSLKMTQKYVQHAERIQEETVCLLGNYFQPRINTHLEQLCGSCIFPPKRNDSVSHFWQIPNEIAQDMLVSRWRGPLVAAASMTRAKEEVTFFTIVELKRVSWTLYEHEYQQSEVSTSVRAIKKNILIR